MLHVHLNDGKTLRFDLEDKAQCEKWINSCKDAKFQKLITALTVVYDGVQYSVTRPDSYKNTFMFAEHLGSISEKKFKGGKRLIVQADDTRLAVMIHLAQKASRITLNKTGTFVFNPIARL